MFMKKITHVIIVLLSVITMFSVTSSAVTLLTEEQALKEMFPDMDNVTSETLTLTGDEIALIKGRLGGSLVHYQVGSQSEKVAEKTVIKFYIGTKNNEKVRVAMVDEQPGKWGPVQFIIALDTSTGKINNLAVMAYVEKRGRPIAMRNFLKQFIGKGSSDHISVRSGPGVRIDINAISGATISSDCTCFAVKKAIALYEEVFVKKLYVSTK